MAAGRYGPLVSTRWRRLRWLSAIWIQLLNWLLGGAMAALSVTVYLESSPPRHYTPWRWADLTIGLALVVAQTLPVAVRRSYPLAAVVTAELATLVPAASVADIVVPGFAEMLLAFTAGDRVRWPRSGFVVAAIVVSVLLRPAPQPTAWPIRLINLLFILALWGGGLAQQHARRRQATAGSARAATALTDERSSIARELHDVVAHHVSGIVVQSGAAHTAFHQDSVRLAAALATIRNAAHDAQTALARLVGMLSAEPSPDQVEPSLRQLPALIAQVGRTGLQVELAVTGEVLELPTEVDLFAYRIVQEALTNSVKHGGSGRARVVVDYGVDAVALCVDDYGPPAFPVVRAPGGGHGIVGMRERVALLGGELTAGRRPDGGWRVAARLPGRFADALAGPYPSVPLTDDEADADRPAKFWSWPPLFDAALTAGLIGSALVLELYLSRKMPGMQSWPAHSSALAPFLAYLLLLLPIVPVLWRRRAPLLALGLHLAAAAVAYAGYLLNGSVEWAWLILLYSAGAYLPRRRSAIGLAASLAFVVAIAWIIPGRRFGEFTTLSSSVGVVIGRIIWPAGQIVAAWLIGVFVGSKRRRIAQQTQDRAATIITDERARIAHELQHAVAAQLASVQARATTVPPRLFQHHPVSPRMVNGLVMSRLAQRVASVMLVRPARRRALMARLRSEARTRGPERVRTRELSSR